MLCRWDLQIGAAFITGRTEDPKIVVVVGPAFFLWNDVVNVETDPTLRIDGVWIPRAEPAHLAGVAITGEDTGPLLRVDPATDDRAWVWVFQEILAWFQTGAVVVCENPITLIVAEFPDSSRILADTGYASESFRVDHSADVLKKEGSKSVSCGFATASSLGRHSGAVAVTIPATF